MDFTDQAGKRRSKLFPRRKDADVYLVKVRSLVANHTYLADSDSTTVTEAAKAWLDHCEVRCKTGRRMERSTLRGYSDYVRLHIADGDYLYQESLASLERRLDPARFLRIHRSTIVQRSAIERIKQMPFASLVAVLTDGSEVRVGRTYTAAIRSALSA